MGKPRGRTGGSARRREFPFRNNTRSAAYLVGTRWRTIETDEISPDYPTWKCWGSRDCRSPRAGNMREPSAGTRQEFNGPDQAESERRPLRFQPSGVVPFIGKVCGRVSAARRRMSLPRYEAEDCGYCVIPEEVTARGVAGLLRRADGLQRERPSVLREKVMR